MLSEILGGVIEVEKNGVNKLEEAVSAMIKHSAGASESIKELDRFAGPGRLYAGIQRQQISLVCQSLNNFYCFINICSGIIIFIRLLRYRLNGFDRYLSNLIQLPFVGKCPAVAGKYAGKHDPYRRKPEPKQRKV